jgi:hypothetical protein
MAMAVGWNISAETVAGLIISLAALAIAVAVAGYVIGKIRPKPVQDEPAASHWLTKYRELHEKGVLSDAEFHTIKGVLAKQLQAELKDPVSPELKDSEEKGSVE